MNWVKKYLLTKDPKSVKICCILDKKARRTSDVHVDCQWHAVIYCYDQHRRPVVRSNWPIRLYGQHRRPQCTLIDRYTRIYMANTADVGFDCPDEFVVGFGMDFAGHFRTLPFVGVLKPSAYASKAEDTSGAKGSPCVKAIAPLAKPSEIDPI